MSKKLTEMSLAELWQLFPIYLTEYKIVWKNQYADEEINLKRILVGLPICRISHIGSTSVNTIWAKPTVDILIEVPLESNLKNYSDVLSNNGYLCMSQVAKRVSLNKGYTEQGFAEKVFHIHIRHIGDNDELYFRDYLITNPHVAKSYEALKLSLWKKYEHDRDGYTIAKTDFIKKYTKIAKQEYKGRY